MKISDIAIKRPVTTTMMILLIVLLGFISFNRVNLDLYPEMTLPRAALIVEYEGVGPEEIENMVTKPLEGSISTVTNIESLTSTSASGQSMITAEFNWDTDMDNAVMDMRERIDLVEDYLPDEAGDPIIFKFDPSLMPIMQLGVAASTDLATLKRMIEDKISPRLERLEGVASVDLVGGKERQILVTIDQTKLNNYHLSFSTVVNTLMMENVNLSGGKVNRGKRELMVRIKGKFSSLDEIREILIPTPTGLVSLDDIGEIHDTYKEIENKARLNGEASIALLIQKQTDANTVYVSNLIKKELDRLKEEIEELEVVPILDQASFIERSIGNVGKNAIFGGLLAILILFIFLRNVRSTLIIAIAIPVSVIATFMLIYFGNLTLNMMTLGGLALGIGMLVDNSIVVLENIYRYRSLGADRMEAAHKGSSEVGMAIVASTLTTAIVFLPVVFVGGMASQLFQELALTVTFSLLASLLVALTLIPVMSSRILKVKESDITVNDISDESGTKDREESDNIFNRIKDSYQNSLDKVLSHPFIVLMVVLILLVASVTLYPQIGMEFIPEMDQGKFTITAELPVGTGLEETERISTLVEERLLKIGDVKSVLADIGSSGNMNSEQVSHIVNLYVSLRDFHNRERSTEEIIEDLRDKLVIPDVELTIKPMGMMGEGAVLGGSPVSLNIKGDNLQVLEELAVEVKREMEAIPGLREIEDSISEGQPELLLSINRDLAANLGLRPGQIASTVRTSISGTRATRYEVGGQEYDVTIKLAKERINTPEEVMDLLIPSQTGARVPLKRVADFEVKSGPRKILRKNQVRYVNVTADIHDVDLEEVISAIRERIDSNITLPAGYQIEYGGEYKEMQESFGDLSYAFILAIVLVYMVMASQFESLLHPFVVMFTVPLAIIGVLLGLYLTGYKLSVVSMIGIIMLAGIVVNNAIVLVDYINTLRERGRSLREAILEAGPVRLRPIMMTALTTILGLLPMALVGGEGTEVQAPMAIVVIGGLSVATLLTLYVVPVVYLLISRLSIKLSEKIYNQGEQDSMINM